MITPFCHVIQSIEAAFPPTLHSVNRCIRMLATETFGKISVASSRTLCCGAQTLLSSRWTLIESELCSPNFNSSIRAERSFAIRYLIVVTKPLCGNLDICLNCYFRSRNSVRVLSVADRDWKWKMLFWIALFGPALAQFSRFRDQNVFRSQKTRAREYT